MLFPFIRHDPLLHSPPPTHTFTVLTPIMEHTHWRLIRHRLQQQLSFSGPHRVEKWHKSKSSICRIPPSQSKCSSSRSSYSCFLHLLKTCTKRTSSQLVLSVTLRETVQQSHQFIISHGHFHHTGQIKYLNSCNYAVIGWVRGEHVIVGWINQQ